MNRHVWPSRIVSVVDGLPWQSRARRERAVELGLRLSVVKNAYSYEIFHEAFGRPSASNRGAAMLVRHAPGGWAHQT